MKKIIKEGTKRTITCEECGCLFSFEEEDIYHNEFYRNECEKVTGTKLGYKKNMLPALNVRLKLC